MLAANAIERYFVADTVEAVSTSDSKIQYKIAVGICRSSHLLMMALSSISRKTRGFGFPGCGSGVTEPTSTNPNPISLSPAMASPFLSNPAAIPIGLDSVLPRNSVFFNKRYLCTLLAFLIMNILTRLTESTLLSVANNRYWQAQTAS